MLPDTVPLIFDTGASISITPYPTDFILPICRWIFYFNTINLSYFVSNF